MLRRSAAPHPPTRRCPNELAGLLVPDFEHFWWNHPIARSHGHNLYGF